MPRADFAILTIIPEEYEAVIATLSAYGCSTEYDPGSATMPNLSGWVSGDLPGAKNQVYRVVVGIVAKPGPGRMATAVNAICAQYRPPYVLIVGIAGGFPQDGLAKGDVTLSSVIYDYDYGKVAAEFQPRMDFVYQPSQTLLTSAVSLHARDKSWAALNKQMRPDGTDEVPKLLSGAIASGGKIIDDATNDFFAAVRRAWPRLLAVEMEGAGAAAAVEAENAARHNVGFLMVRGISDMPKMGDGAQAAPASLEGNKAERDKWKRYAAATAANFTVHWLSRAWPLAPRPTKRPGSTAHSEDANDDDPPGAAQQASIGNVTGTSNTVTITQTRGPSIEDLARLMQPVAPDINAEIDAACAYLTGGKVDIAIHLLNDLRKKKWDRMTPREKYRLEANIGQALEGKGEFKEAAKHYIEAKRHQPQEERARALEAIAYYHLHDNARAYELAGEILRDHPNFSLAIAIRIRSAPSEVLLADLERSVPVALRDELEILHALGWRALNAGDVTAAERFAIAARSRYPASVEIKEHHATVIVQIEARARQANQPVNREKLEEAVAELTEGIAKSRGQKDEARLRYARAEASDLLGQTEDADTDFRAAIEADKEEPDIARRFALFLMRHDRISAAIDALRKVDKVKQNHINRLMLGGLLGERKAVGDCEAAIELLRETLPQNPEPENRAEMAATITHLLGLLKKHEEAIACLDGLGDGYLSRAVSDAIRSKALLMAGRKEEAQDSARQAMQSLGKDSSETDRMRVAEALADAGAKHEALAVWKEVLKPDCADVFVCTALKFAQETGDDEFIMSFCRELRAAGVWRPFPLELEVMTLEKYSSFGDAISVMQEYIAGTPDDDLSRVFRVRLSLIGLRRGRPELVEADIARLPPVETPHVKLGAATAYVLKNGPCPEHGIEYAYELVRRHFDDPLARQAYVGVVGIGDGEAFLPEPSVVAPGCAVRFKADDTGEEEWVIVEDGAAPSSDREEIGRGHIWAAGMAGKTVGEKFDLRRDPLQGRTATIQAICSKYAYRKFEIIDGWEKRFPDKPFARKYTFPTKEDGSPDISLILNALDLKERQREEMHSIYRNNPISATTFARLSDAGLLESLSHLASEGTLPIRCCRGTAEELQQAEAALSGTGLIVIEPSGLATLFFSGQYEQLRLLASRCIVCEGALEEYSELRRKFAERSHGFVAKFKGKYLFREDEPAERERQEQRLDKFLSSIRSLVTIRSGKSLAALSPERRDELIDLFGQPTAEAIAEAASTGAALWTDDIAVAEFAKERTGVEKRIWTQMVFRSVAPPDVYADLTLFLLADGFGYDWVQAAEPGADGLYTFRLAKDVPIRGRILSLEGRPVAKAKLTISRVEWFRENRLDEYIAAWKSGRVPFSADRIGVPPPGQPDSVETDADGQFSFRGVGAERVANLVLEGRGIARARLSVMTREAEAIVLPGKLPLRTHGALFTYLADPSRLIRGVVRERGTKTPIAGVEVRARSAAPISAKTDAAGRFELHGYPKAEKYYLDAAGHGSPYFSASLTVADQPGFDPIDVEFEMARGIEVSGRVTTAAAGKPNPAYVEYCPLYRNPYTDRVGPEFTKPCSSVQCDADGRYTIPVLPGPGILTFQIANLSKGHFGWDSQTYARAWLSRQEIIDFYESASVKPPEDIFENSVPISMGGQAFITIGPSSYNEIELINPADGEMSLTRDIELPLGGTLDVKLVDADGKPVAGTIARGLTNSAFKIEELKGPEFTLVGLSPHIERQLIVEARERKLAAYKVIRGEQQVPLTLRLEPCGAITGRLLDAAGEPLAESRLGVGRQ